MNHAKNTERLSYLLTNIRNLEVVPRPPCTYICVYFVCRAGSPYFEFTCITNVRKGERRTGQVGTHVTTSSFTKIECKIITPMTGESSIEHR